MSTRVKSSGAIAKQQRASSTPADTVHRKDAAAQSGEASEVHEIDGRKSPSYYLNNRIFFRLFQLGNLLQRQTVQQLGITTVQWSVLGALSQPKFADGIPLSDLGEYLLVTRQNLDGVLKRLERDGLVCRVTADSDRRSRLVQLTPKGHRYWLETVERIYEFYEQAAASFTFDDRVALVHHMNRLQKDLAKVKLERGTIPKRRRA